MQSDENNISYKYIDFAIEDVSSWKTPHITALWADKWTFEKKSTLFFEISSLPIFSLCLPHLHNEIRDIFLSVQDNTQNEIFVFEVGGLDSLIRGYIAGNKKCAKTDKLMFITSEYILIRND